MRFPNSNGESHHKNGEENKMKTEKYPISNEKGVLNTKEQWKNLLKGPKLRLLFLTIFFIIAITTLLMAFYLMILLCQNIFGKIIYKNFGLIDVRSIQSWILISSGFSIMSWLIIYVLKEIKKIKIDFWFSLFVVSVTFFSVFGFLSVDYFGGGNQAYLGLNLFDQKGEVAGKIECRGAKGLIIGEKIFCEADLKEQTEANRSVFVKLTLPRETDRILLQKGYFIAQENVSYIDFEVYEQRLQNKTEKYQVGYPYKFLTEKEFEENRMKFLKYSIGLLAVIFVSIPISIVNIRKLWRNEK